MKKRKLLNPEHPVLPETALQPITEVNAKLEQSILQTASPAATANEGLKNRDLNVEDEAEEHVEPIKRELFAKQES